MFVNPTLRWFKGIEGRRGGGGGGGDVEVEGVEGIRMAERGVDAAGMLREE